MANSPEVMEYLKQRGKLTATLLNPLKSKEKKRQAYREYVDSLSDEIWQQVGLLELDKMQFEKKTCQEYVSTEAQVKAFLEWLPRYKPFEDIVRDKTRQVRQKYDLPL